MALASQAISDRVVGDDSMPPPLEVGVAEHALGGVTVGPLVAERHCLALVRRWKHRLPVCIALVVMEEEEHR